ncbi:MAG: TIGR00304 family membrane protein [Candidatus Bathyarchaeia archaeon]
MSMINSSLAILGFVFVLVGVLVVLVAIIILLFSSMNEEETAKGGGAIIIGPIPIVFGTDKKSVKTLLGLSIVLMALALIVYVAFNYL